MPNEYSREELLDLRKKFPARFKKLPCTVPPNDAKPQYMLGYRLTTSPEDELNTYDFVPYDQEKPYMKGNNNNETNPNYYGVSILLNGEAVAAVRRHAGQRDKNVVKGYIKEKYGFSKVDGIDHASLWLYDDATPWLDFTEEEN